MDSLKPAAVFLPHLWGPKGLWQHMCRVFVLIIVSSALFLATSPLPVEDSAVFSPVPMKHMLPEVLSAGWAANGYWICFSC